MCAATSSSCRWTSGLLALQPILQQWGSYKTLFRTAEPVTLDGNGIPNDISFDLKTCPPQWGIEESATNKSTTCWFERTHGVLENNIHINCPLTLVIRQDGRLLGPLGRHKNSSPMQLEKAQNVPSRQAITMDGRVTTTSVLWAGVQTHNTL